MNLLSSKSGWNVERISQGHNVVGTVLRLAPCREILDVQRSALGQALPVVGGGRNCLDLFAKTLQERLGVTHGTNSAVIHHSCDSAGPLDTLRLANEELKRQLAPQSGVPIRRATQKSDSSRFRVSGFGFGFRRLKPTFAVGFGFRVSSFVA